MTRNWQDVMDGREVNLQTPPEPEPAPAPEPLIDETDAERRARTWGDPAWMRWYSAHGSRCGWDIQQQAFTSHSCNLPQEFDPEDERWAPPALKPPATVEPSVRRGRITDRTSAREELTHMAQVVQDDDRLTACDHFVYGVMSSRGWKFGSVFVIAALDYLASRAAGKFTRRQCRTSLERLEVFGLIERKKWSYVAKNDRLLHDYARKVQRDNKGGRMPTAYLLKQDPPGSTDVMPDEVNPILEMFGLSA